MKVKRKISKCVEEEGAVRSVQTADRVGRIGQLLDCGNSAVCNPVSAPCLYEQMQGLFTISFTHDF